MTDEQIFELAKSCGFDVNNDKLWMSWEEQLLKFALAIHEDGYNKGYDDGVNSVDEGMV